MRIVKPIMQRKLGIGGDCPRGLVRGHSVVFYKGKMVHDPHPSGEGITAIRSA